MFSERGNDGIERSGEQWFKRHNAKAPEKGGARKSRAAKAGDWLEKTRKAWEQTANRALERAGRAERIDGRSLADLRDEAHRAGDLKRAAELSREPNVHLGPERYRTIRGGASETVKQAGRVDRINAADRGERDADSRQVERLEREIAGVEARLKEIYDRVRTAIDERIRQVNRAIRQQEQKQLHEEVNSLGSYVQKLERQVNASAKQHREEVNKLTERVEDLIKQHAEALLDFQKRCNTLVGDVNAFARLLEEEWK